MSAFPFEKLPADIEGEIFGMIDLQTLIRARLINKRWKKEILNEPIWKLLFRRDFPYSAETPVHYGGWFHMYKEYLSFCRFDPVEHNPNIQVSEDGMKATCSSQSRKRDRIPVRGQRGVTTGVHLFSMYIESYEPAKKRDNFHCSIGIATSGYNAKSDEYVKVDVTWIQYYCDGLQYVNGAEACLEEEKFGVGDTVSCLIDMDKQGIYFFKNNKCIGGPHLLLTERDITNKSIFPVCNLCRGLTVKIAHSSIDVHTLPEGHIEYFLCEARDPDSD